MTHLVYESRRSQAFVHTGKLCALRGTADFVNYAFHRGRRGTLVMMLPSVRLELRIEVSSINTPTRFDQLHPTHLC